MIYRTLLINFENLSVIVTRRKRPTENGFCPTHIKSCLAVTDIRRLFQALKLRLIHRRHTLKGDGGVNESDLRSVSGNKEYLSTADHMFRGIKNFQNFL